MVLLPRYIAAVGALAAGAKAAVNPVIVQGTDFVDTVTKNRVMIIGVDYQPGGQAAYDPNAHKDVLSDGAVCLRDAALLQKLGINTIRVYNVDPTANHDLCASIFNTAGIYMIIDVNSPQESINRAEPAGSYTTSYLSRVFGIVEAFKAYPNTMGFFAANEVMNDVETAKDNPPYIRAVQRDLKQYIANHSPRPIPVGYSAADVRSILEDTWAYFQCQDSNSTGTDFSRSDFFGLNSYSWCGSAATYTSAGYDQLVSMFEKTTIPVFFSEYGCNKPSGADRPFNEVQALYGKQMTGLSGGLVYEYSQEESDYGLVVINKNGSVSMLPGYENLKGQYGKLDINLLESTTAAQTSAQPPVCSADLITAGSGFTTDFSVPKQPSGAAAVIKDGIKNPNKGKIVDVKDLQVKQQVFDSKGKEVKGLVVTPVDKANMPGGAGAAGSGTTTGGATASPTKKGAAGKVSSSGLMMMLTGLVAVGLAFVA